MTTSDVAAALSRAFARLPWSVFNVIPTIRVVEISGVELRPLIDYSLAAEASSTMSLQEMYFNITGLANTKAEISSHPTKVIARGKDGHIVIIADVVVELLSL